MKKDCYTNHISWRYVETDKKKLITACPLAVKLQLKKIVGIRTNEKIFRHRILCLLYFTL